MDMDLPCGAGCSKTTEAQVKFIEFAGFWFCANSRHAPNSVSSTLIWTIAKYERLSKTLKTGAQPIVRASQRSMT